MWLLFCGMSIDAGIAAGIFCHKLTINIKNILTNIKSVIGYPVIKCLKYLSLAACQIIKGVEWKGTDHFIGAAVIVGICIYFIGVSFQHGYELQKEADEIL